jgi:hypothetical protein
MKIQYDFNLKENGFLPEELPASNITILSLNNVDYSLDLSSLNVTRNSDEKIVGKIVMKSNDSFVIDWNEDIQKIENL